MLKEEFLAKITQPIVDLYSYTEDSLLLSVVRHLKTGKKTDLVEWEVRKLSEMGALRNEAIRTVAKTNRKAQTLLSQLLNSTALEALRSNGVGKPEITKNIVQLVSTIQMNATNHLNVVNSTMVSSTVAKFRGLADSIFQAVEDKKNRILGEEATRLTLGTTGVEKSVKSAIVRLSNEGITAFTDSIGRNWSPEGYVRMDMVTTANNTARTVIQEQGKGLGLDIILVSSHGGARPLCAPYQGRCFSLSGRSGTITDANGNTYEFEPISVTGYDPNSRTNIEPAGLFGINCRHYFRYIEEGSFINRETVLDTEKADEKNAREYAISQQMRAYERNIRKDTRTAQMLDTFEKGAGAEYTARANKLKEEYASYARQSGFSPEWARTKVY